MNWRLLVLEFVMYSRLSYTGGCFVLKVVFEMEVVYNGGCFVI